MRTVSDFLKINATILNTLSSILQSVKRLGCAPDMSEEEPKYFYLFNSVQTNLGTDPPTYEQVKR
jgi:hypothetical protein